MTPTVVSPVPELSGAGAEQALSAKPLITHTDSSLKDFLTFMVSLFPDYWGCEDCKNHCIDKDRESPSGCIWFRADVSTSAHNVIA